MPRTRRTPAPDAEAAQQPQTSEVAATPPTTSEGPPEPAKAPRSRRRTKPDTAVTAPEPETTPKARSTRGRRTAPQEAGQDAAVTPVASSPEVPSPEATPQRRPGGRRTKTPTTEIAPLELEAPVAPVEATPVEATPVEATPVEATPVEATPVEATPVEATPVEATPTVSRRARGRRTSAAIDTVPVSPETASEPAAETPPVQRRGRGRRSPANEITESAPAAESTPPTPSRSSRSRRRRAEAPVTEDIPDLEAPVLDEVTEASNTPNPAKTENVPPPLSSRRRRGRRGQETTPAQAADANSEAVETESAPAPETEEDAKRGRRGRRSRRRRGDDAVDANMTEGELIDLDEPVSPPEDDLGLDFSLPLIAAPPPIYVAPQIVPPVLAPADGAALPRVAAHIAHPIDGRGLPQITVNETPHAPFFFFVNTETAINGEVVDDEIKASAAAGIHLYSGVMYLPLRNAYGDRSFGATDALIQQILASDPDAYILPRLQCVPTNYWARTHEDQMAKYADGSEGDVSLASTDFWADCTDALEALLAHLSDPATPGGDRVIGFHLDRGEWFYDREAGYDYSAPNVTAFQNWLHARYQQPFALRAAWFNGTVTFDDAAIPAWTAPVAGKAETQPVYATARDARWPDYALFASELVASIITGLADAVKTLSENRLLVAVSYGYTLEFATRNDSGHLALAALLRSPSIDILAGPNSYTNRAAGGASSFPAPIDSAALHSKLWLVEDDTKTFLADAETDDTYNPKIASGADTQAAHQRHFGAALAHGAGVTWMDLWGQGWLNDPEIWRELGILRDQANRLTQTSSVNVTGPDVAFLVDEASLAYLRNQPAGVGHSLVSKTRDLLLRTGASVGFYLQSDITHEKFPDAKLYLFANALRITTAEKQAIREKLQQPGKTLAWMYAPGLFDERGVSEVEIGDIIGMGLRLQPWNARLGSQITDVRHPLTERLRGGKKTIGVEETLNPSYAVTDPQATVLAEYISTGAASLAVREHPTGWKSVFFGDPHLTVELLRGLYAYAGVVAYDTQDDITYAGPNGALTIHAPFTGQRTIALPRTATVYDVTEDRIVATNARSFRTFLRSRSTRMFLWGDADDIAKASGLTLPIGEPVPIEDTAQEEPTVTPGPDTSAMSALVADILAPLDDDSSAQLEAFAREDADYDNSDLDAASEPDTEGAQTDDARPSAPRSRWQRRRAALRAKREAERSAQALGASTSETGGTSTPPVDFATLMPGLPPRRVPPVPAESQDGSQDDE